MDRLNRSKGATQTEVAALYARSNETEKRLLKEMYARTVVVGGAFGAVGVLASLRMRAGPLLSAVAGSALGISCATADTMGQMPSRLLAMAQTPGPSGVIDEIVCPAVRELERALLVTRDRSPYIPNARTPNRTPP